MMGGPTGEHSSRGGPAAGAGIVAALDLGSTKIACIIADISGARKRVDGDSRSAIKVLGIGQTASRGIRSGAVVNVDEAERAIRLAVDAAERTAQRRIREVYVNVSGGKPQSLVSRATVSTQTGVVSPRDADAAVSAAISHVPVGKRHVLHIMPIGFSLDGAVSSTAPLGLHGKSLGADISLVTVEPAALRNLCLAVEQSHLSVAGFSLSPFAAARGVLLPDELLLGTVLIDMGGATTGVAMFRDGALASASMVPVGGSHVTHDIAQGLSTTIAHAERMKTLFGTVLPYGHDERELLAVPLLGERGVDTVQKVPRSVLTAIIRPRLEETFDLVRRRIEADSQAGLTAVRVVLTGGASQLPGVRELAAELLGRQTRVAMPQGLQNLPDTARGGNFAVAAGLVAGAARPERTYAMPRQAQAAIDRSQMTYVQRVGRWLAEAI